MGFGGTAFCCWATGPKGGRGAGPRCATWAGKLFVCRTFGTGCGRKTAGATGFFIVGVVGIAIVLGFLFI